MAQPKAKNKNKNKNKTKQKTEKPQTNKAHIQSGQMYLYSTENQKKLGGHLFFFFYFGEDARKSVPLKSNH